MKSRIDKVFSAYTYFNVEKFKGREYSKIKNMKYAKRNHRLSVNKLIFLTRYVIINL